MKRFYISITERFTINIVQVCKTLSMGCYDGEARVF